MMYSLYMENVFVRNNKWLLMVKIFIKLIVLYINKILTISLRLVTFKQSIQSTYHDFIHYYKISLLIIDNL